MPDVREDGVVGGGVGRGIEGGLDGLADHGAVEEAADEDDVGQVVVDREEGERGEQAARGGAAGRAPGEGVRLLLEPCHFALQ
ncbi:hypothetical protein GCM10020221_09460 [Streptomyces thioluteus]|uniref:Uncharacterized protein n=1 Tax=Streptomyces thioluteus TaxID=66431 RepID=A0ABN3WJR6_STRTU